MSTEAERLASAFDTGDYTIYEIKAAAALLRQQAAEIERLKSTPPAQREDLYCVIADLTRQCQESDALLRQALEALESVLKANRVGIRPPTTVMQAERQLDQIRAAGTAAESSIAAIKQHLGEDHGN